MRQIFSPRLLEWISNSLHTNRRRRIRRLIADMHPADLADFIDGLDDRDRFIFFNMISDEVAADMISELRDDSRRTILNQVKSEQLATIVMEMDTDDAADILGELKEERINAVFNKIRELDKEKADELYGLLQYEEKTAGGIMDT